MEMQQTPGAGGQLGERGERVLGTQGGQVGIGGNGLAPKSVLLGGVEQEPGVRAGEEKLMPEAFEPGVERPNLGGVPAGVSGSFLGSIKRGSKDAGGTLVGGQDQCAATESVRNGGRHAGRRAGRASGLHGPVIRRGGLEIAVRIPHAAWWPAGAG